MADFHVPLIIRGEVIEDADLSFKTRYGGVTFTTPDVRKHIKRLPLSSPLALADLQALKAKDIIEFMDELGKRMQLSQNRHMQDAFKMSLAANGMTDGIIQRIFERMGNFLSAPIVQQAADSIGVDYIDGWVEKPLANGGKAAIRSIGARSVHITAGNVPSVSASTLVQNAVTRSDIIIKTPSNDPLTAAAIVLTAIEMAPDHPITRHMSVAYWKGGDTEVEEALYQPQNIDKIIAWGGFASITHIQKYIQPGIDLITLDPKLSSSMVGREAFQDDEAMAEAARRLAIDIGARNQEACHSARVIYIESGLDPDGLAKANAFGKMVMDEIKALPPYVSAPAREPNVELMEEVATLKILRGAHKVFGNGPEGAVIVSQTNEVVDFARILANRVANLVPVDTLDEALGAVNAYTQTVGIYPDSRRRELRDRLTLHGAQRTVSLGYAGQHAGVGPHDGLEPIRRMCKWVVDEEYSPEVTPLATVA